MGDVFRVRTGGFVYLADGLFEKAPPVLGEALPVGLGAGCSLVLHLAAFGSQSGILGL